MATRIRQLRGYVDYSAAMLKRVIRELATGRAPKSTLQRLQGTCLLSHRHTTLYLDC
jgi:hypothetical protein